ncbi:hypothetical protein [uncultured Shewanella sp.]|uniref:hypothetical protein n=1 Tax=uncultured Shewanella sp. TaxID=173975 RepID=UPI00260D2479|nr:hypothetical protein [uncultured Shewanella sp.]
MPKAIELIDNLIAQITQFQSASNTVTNSEAQSHTQHTALDLQRRINECEGTIALTHYDPVSTDINENNLSLDNGKKLKKVIALYSQSVVDENLNLNRDCLITSQQDVQNKMDIVDHDAGRTSKTKWVIRDGNLYIASHAPWRQLEDSNGTEKKKIHHLEFNINSFATLEEDMTQGSIFCGGELKVNANGKVTSFNIDCSYSKEGGKGEYKQQAKENGYASLLHFNQLGLLPDNLDELNIG